MNISKRVSISHLLLLIWVLLSCQTKQQNMQIIGELNKPLPPFLAFVSPSPQTAYGVNAYELGEHYPSGEVSAAEGNENRVCIQIDPIPLLEAGDYFVFSEKHGNFLPNRITGYINGIETKRDEGVTTVLGTGYLQDENGYIIAEAEGPQIVCWLAELDAGQHVFIVEIEKTSGEVVNYGWSFTLTNDENTK